MKQFKSFCPTQACTTPDFGFLGSQNSASIYRGCGGGDGGNAAPEQQGRVEESEDLSEEEDEDEKKVFKFTLFISSTVSPSTSLVKIICEHSSRNFCLSCYRTRSNTLLHNTYVPPDPSHANHDATLPSGGMPSSSLLDYGITGVPPIDDGPPLLITITASISSGAAMPGVRAIVAVRDPAPGGKGLGR